MGNVTEVKTVFTVDLTAFVDGLKTMLSMTAATGQQLKPLLNLDVKAPDTSGLEAQLKALAERTQNYLKATQDSAAAINTSSTGEAEHEENVNKASVAVGRKSESLKGMKRQALESFGAISFLITGIVELSSRLGGGNKELEKLSQGMSQGISAGFGLASTMSILGLATGGVAVAIGVVVAAGIALLSFFNDADEKAQSAAIAMEIYSQKIRGLDLSQLESELKRLQGINIEDTWLKNPEHLQDKINKVRSMINSMRKSEPEAEKFVQDEQIKAMQDGFAKQRAMIDLAYEREKKEWKDKKEAIRAIELKHNEDLRKLAEDEARFNQQIADQKFEANLNRVRAQGLKTGEIQERVDLQILESRSRYYGQQYDKLLALGSNASSEQIQQRSQLEATLTKIELDKAQKRIDIQRTEFENRLQIIETEGQKIVAAYKLASYERGDVPEKTSAGVIEIEKSITEKKLQEYNKRQAADEKLTSKEIADAENLNRRIIELSAEAAQGELDAREKLKDTRKSIGELELKNRKDEQSEELAQVDDWLAKVKQTYSVTAEDINRAEKAAADRRVQITKEAEEKKRQAILEGAAGIANNLVSMANSLSSITEQRTSKEVGEEKKRLQAALDTEKEKKLATAKSSAERDKIEKDYAAKKEALDVEMNNKAKAANADAFAMQKTFSIVQATIATYESATKAYNALAGIPIVGPGLAVAAAAAAIAAGLANIAVIQSQEVPGLAEGGRLRKGQAGYIEGWNNEIVAPEKTFIQVFREDLMPEVMKVMLSERPRDILFPRIKESVLEAPAKLLKQNTRDVVLEALQTQLSVSNQSGGNIGSGRNAIHIHVEVKNLIGTKEFVKNDLKPAIEGVMRELGASSINDVFINKFK